MTNQFKNMRTSSKAVTITTNSLLQQTKDTIEKHNLYKIKNYFIKNGVI